MSRRALIVMGAGAFFLSACVTTEREPPPTATPTPRSVKLKADPSAPPSNNPMRPVATVDKPMFNIRVSPLKLMVNDREVAGLSKLEELFKTYPNAVITIEAHKCLSSADASRLMNLAQSYTETPIPFGSWGNYTDPECQ